MPSPSTRRGRSQAPLASAPSTPHRAPNISRRRTAAINPLVGPLVTGELVFTACDAVQNVGLDFLHDGVGSMLHDLEQHRSGANQKPFSKISASRSVIG